MGYAHDLPRVSVCMPTFVTTDAAAGYLAEAVRSVLAQDEPRLELIVVDDGPRGPVEAVLAEVAADGSAARAVRYLHNKTNLGTASTRNRAAAESSTEYLAFIDADDRWAPGHLASLLAAADAAHADVTFCPIAEFSTDPAFRPHYRAPEPRELSDLPNALFHRCFIIPSATMVRRQGFQDIGGFHDGQRHCEDLDLWLRFACARARFAFSPGATCEYRRHALAKTTLGVNMRMHRALVYNRFHAAPQIDRWLRRARRTKAWWQTARAAGSPDGVLALKAAAESARAVFGLAPSAEAGFLPHIKTYAPTGAAPRLGTVVSRAS